MAKEDIPYDDDDWSWDGTCDHVDTIRRPKKEKETQALLYNVPWMGHQAIRNKKNPNSFINIPFLWGQDKKKKQKE